MKRAPLTFQDILLDLMKIYNGMYTINNQKDNRCPFCGEEPYNMDDDFPEVEDTISMEDIRHTDSCLYTRLNETIMNVSMETMSPEERIAFYEKNAINLTGDQNADYSGIICKMLGWK